MARTYTDGTYTSAFAVTPLIKQPALAGVKDDLIATQDYVILQASYTAAALNTPHPDEADPLHPVWVLVAEDNKRDLGGDIMQFTRRYARKPDTYSEAQGTISYNFIGFDGSFGINIPTITGRPRFVKTVAVRAQHDFFLVGPESYCDYATPQDIPITPEQTYYRASSTQATDYLNDGPPTFTEASSPSRTEYETLISTGSEIVAQASSLERWQGNIYRRTTLYIRAQ